METEKIIDLSSFLFRYQLNLISDANEAIRYQFKQRKIRGFKVVVEQRSPYRCALNEKYGRDLDRIFY